MTTGDIAVDGSGSTFIEGFIDANYKPNMSKADCTDFLKSCVQLAVYRDGSSGGCIRLVSITKDKIEKDFINYGSFHFR